MGVDCKVEIETSGPLQVVHLDRWYVFSPRFVSNVWYDVGEALELAGQLLVDLDDEEEEGKDVSYERPWIGFFVDVLKQDPRLTGEPASETDRVRFRTDSGWEY